MRFDTWLAEQPRGTMMELCRKTGLGLRTLYDAKEGKGKREYSTARKISDATGGAVSIAELCEAAPPPKLSTRAKPKHPRRGRPERVTTQRGHR